MMGDRVKVEETLQSFSQLVMLAVTANTDVRSCTLSFSIYSSCLIPDICFFPIVV